MIPDTRIIKILTKQIINISDNTNYKYEQLGILID